MSMTSTRKPCCSNHSTSTGTRPRCLTTKPAKIVERNARCRQWETLLNPSPPQGERVATVLQVVNGRANQLGLTFFHPFFQSFFLGEALLRRIFPHLFCYIHLQNLRIFQCSKCLTP